MNLQQAMSASAGGANNAMQDAASVAASTPIGTPRRNTPLILQTKQAESVSIDMLLQQSIKQIDALLNVTDVMAQAPQNSKENTNVGTP